MDERSARAAIVFANVAFLAFAAALLWLLYRRLVAPAPEPARVFRLVPLPSEEDDAPEAPAEPAPDRPKKKGH